MTNTLYKLELLKKSGLLKNNTNLDQLQAFPAKEWLLRIIELNWLKTGEGFYKKLAVLYKLDYESELSPPLNPKDSIAYRVPTEILIDSQLYPFMRDGKTCIATSTPFIDQTVLDNVLSFTGRAGYKLVMTNPTQLREALKRLYYIEFSAVAESKLKLTRKALSASPPIILRLAKFIIAIGAFTILSVFILPKSFLLGLFFAINIFYIYLNGLKLIVFIESLTRGKIVTVTIDQKSVNQLEDSYLPRYTILAPLRFEGEIVNQLVRNLAVMNYPKNKLEIMFLVGVDDEETITALNRAGVDSAGNDATNLAHMTIIKVPKVQVDTKPLVCNYGLRFATGDYTVIFDAEDKPDVDQLKKAVLGFQNASLDTVCMQGKLNFYNSHENLLTRFFSLEYGMWYDFFLPGLQFIGSPVPLGGTSNHFITKALRQAGEWDPYNVTEDADLGMRIYRSNYRTRILEAYTLEEATTAVMPWLKQRARWEKGFLATLMVHVRHPVSLYKDLGPSKFIYGLTIFFGNFYMPFINPLLWIITVMYLLGLFSFGALPAFIWLPAIFNLIVGNMLHISMHLISAIKQKRYDLAPLAFIMPLYWVLISIATYMASWDILTRPYQWVKTPHGKG